MSSCRLLMYGLITCLCAIGCQGSGNELENEKSSGDSETNWWLDDIAEPSGPPKSAEALARHIQYGIQEQDKEKLRQHYFQESADGFQLMSEKVDRSVADLLSTKKRKLTAMKVVALSNEEIAKRLSLVAERKVETKLEPELSHEIQFEYDGPMAFGSSRITALSVGHRDGIYYLATLHAAEAD